MIHYQPPYFTRPHLGFLIAAELWNILLLGCQGAEYKYLRLCTLELKVCTCPALPLFISQFDLVGCGGGVAWGSRRGGVGVGLPVWVRQRADSGHGLNLIDLMFWIVGRAVRY